MRRIVLSSSLLLLTSLLWTGCAGPEQKMGRGLLNATEFTRLGEIRRSMEQTALFEGTDRAYTTGFIRGVNRSLARTGVGIYEIVTAPLPPYGPVFTSRSEVFPDESIANKSYPYGGLVLPEDPQYPANYKPGIISDSTFFTDSSLGFSGGDVAPFLPGSRFRIFE